MASNSRRLDFNMLPESYRRGLLTVQQVAMLTVMVVLLAMLVPVYGLTAESVAEVSALNSEKASVEIQVQNVQGKQQALAQLQEETDRYLAVLGRQGVLTDRYALIVSSLVSGIQLGDVEVTTEKMTFFGTADGVNALYGDEGFETVLKAQEEFASVELVFLDNPWRSGVTEVRFRVDIAMAAK